MTTLPPSQGALARTVRRVAGGDGAVRRRIELRFAARTARRRLVGVWVASVVAAAVLPLADRLEAALGPALVVDGRAVEFFADPLLFLLLTGLLGLTVRTAVRSVADLPDDRLDERQVALRDRSYLVAYRIVATSFAALLVAAYIVADATATRAAADAVATWVVSDLLFAILPLVTFLPSAVLAWYSEDAEDDGA